MANAPIGVIEGFYGKPWTWRERKANLLFLKKMGAQFYIYAPKSDAILREDWRKDWDKQTQKKLRGLRDYSASLGIDFGFGLSVSGIECTEKKELLTELKKKIEKINAIAPDILCVQFDDLPGNAENLAITQSELVNRVREWSTARRIILCPTYYSSSARLNEISGKMPANYWEDLGKNVLRDIDIFWTGKEICSETYLNADLDDISTSLRREPFLWDNYPVNDGDMASKLHLMPVFRPAKLWPHISGIAINPMNEAFLSRIALFSTIGQLKKNGRSLCGDFSATLRAVKSVCKPKIAQCIIEDTHLFQFDGLEELSVETKAILKKRYAKFLPDPFAREIIAWLDGMYRFDG